MENGKWTGARLTAGPSPFQDLKIILKQAMIQSGQRWKLKRVEEGLHAVDQLPQMPSVQKPVVELHRIGEEQPSIPCFVFSPSDSGNRVVRVAVHLIAEAGER